MSGGKLIAICGGIGSGKSVVCRIVAAMGHEVYDCDSRAKEIMDCSAEIKNAIACRVHREAIAPDGSIDRRRLGEIVFSDAEALARLNSIVHAAVREDLALWAARRPGKLLFVETAILYQSGLDAMVDEVWDVEAPQNCVWSVSWPATDSTLKLSRPASRLRIPIGPRGFTRRPPL